MSITDRASLTAYFETGDIPTQDNFVDLIESSANLSGDNTFRIAPKVTTNEGAVGNYPNTLLINGIGLEKIYDSGAATDASEGTGDALVLRGASSVLSPVTGDGSSINVFANLPSDAIRLDKSKTIVFNSNQHSFNGLGELNDSSLLEIKSGSTAYKEESNLSAAEICMLGHMSISRIGLSSTDMNIRDTSSTTVSSVSSIFNINVNDLPVMTLSGGAVSTKVIASANIEAPTVTGSLADFNIGCIGQVVFNSSITEVQGPLSSQGGLTVDGATSLGITTAEQGISTAVETRGSLGIPRKEGGYMFLEQPGGSFRAGLSSTNPNNTLALRGGTCFSMFVTSLAHTSIGAGIGSCMYECFPMGLNGNDRTDTVCNGRNRLTVHGNAVIQSQKTAGLSIIGRNLGDDPHTASFLTLSGYETRAAGSYLASGNTEFFLGRPYLGTNKVQLGYSCDNRCMGNQERSSSLCKSLVTFSVLDDTATNPEPLVGIGTTAPSETLTVAGTLSAVSLSAGNITASNGITGDIAGCTSITVCNGIIIAAS